MNADAPESSRKAQIDAVLLNSRASAQEKSTALTPTSSATRCSPASAATASDCASPPPLRMNCSSQGTTLSRSARRHVELEGMDTDQPCRRGPSTRRISSYSGLRSSSSKPPERARSTPMALVRSGSSACRRAASGKPAVAESL